MVRSRRTTALALALALVVGAAAAAVAAAAAAGGAKVAAVKGAAAFEALGGGATARPVLLQLRSPRCGLCRKVDALFAALAEEHPRVAFASIDVAEEPEVSARLGAKFTPAIFYISRGRAVQYDPAFSPELEFSEEGLGAFLAGPADEIARAAGKPFPPPQLAPLASVATAAWRKFAPAAWAAFDAASRARAALVAMGVPSQLAYVAVPLALTVWAFVAVVAAAWVASARADGREPSAAEARRRRRERGGRALPDPEEEEGGEEEEGAAVSEVGAGTSAATASSQPPVRATASGEGPRRRGVRGGVRDCSGERGGCEGGEGVAIGGGAADARSALKARLAARLESDGAAAAVRDLLLAAQAADAADAVAGGEGGNLRALLERLIPAAGARAGRGREGGAAVHAKPGRSVYSSSVQ